MLSFYRENEAQRNDHVSSLGRDTIRILTQEFTPRCTLLAPTQVGHPEHHTKWMNALHEC